MKLNRFGIHIKVKDIGVSYHYYSTLGLKGIFAYGSDKWLKKIKKDFPSIDSAPEKYNGVTFEGGNSLIEIADDHIAVKRETFLETVKSSKVSAMIDVDSVDEVVNVCNENGFEIAVDPKEYPWGTREVVVRDPDGFILVFREVKYM